MTRKAVKMMLCFSFTLKKKSKALFVKTYTEKELNKVFNKYIPDIEISACEYEIDYYHKTDSSIYVRSYELELDQVLKRELAAREIYDIDIDFRDSTYTYTVNYRKIDKPYIESKIVGNYMLQKLLVRNLKAEQKIIEILKRVTVFCCVENRKILLIIMLFWLEQSLALIWVIF